MARIGGSAGRGAGMHGAIGLGVDSTENDYHAVGDATLGALTSERPITDRPKPRRTDPDRRLALAAMLGCIGLVLRPSTGHAQLRSQTQAALDRLRAGRTARQARVTLRMPPIAENGNTVPITVLVDSPMTATDHVKAIHVLADRNPFAEVASFHLTPAMGRAEISTRIRLAETQEVLALAELSDGSLLSGQVSVNVTIGGCTG